MSKIVKLAAAVIAVIFLAGVALTFLISLGTIPDSKAVTGDNLPARAVKEILENGIINEGEEISYFYSEDLMSFVNYGNLFTQTRIISYELDEQSEKRNVYSAVYSDVSDIQFEKSSGPLEDSLIYIYVDGEHEFSLVVSAEDNGDDKFYQELVETWNRNRTNSEASQ